MAGITHKNGDPAACVDSLLAATFGSPGRTLSASEAREQLYAMAQLVIPMPDSLPDPATTKGAEGPYALALDEHPRVANELEVRVVCLFECAHVLSARVASPGVWSLVAKPGATLPARRRGGGCNTRQHHPSIAHGARLGKKRGRPPG